MSKPFDKLFLSVGAMKAGTTWIYAALARHPKLTFTPEKELHYFHVRALESDFLHSRTRQARARDKYIPILRGDKGRKEFPLSKGQRVARALKSRILGSGVLNMDDLPAERQAWIKAYLSDPVDDAWFNSLFQSDDPDAYACEFSNMSAVLPAEAWSDIAAQTETLRVLYTLRDPVERLWSHTKFHLEMKKQLNLLETWRAKDFEDFARQPSTWTHAEYGQICKKLLTSLPAGIVRIQSYETIRTDPVQTLRDIETFLGLEPFNYPKWLFKRRPVQSVAVPMPDFYRDIFKDDVARIKDELADLNLTVQNAWA